MVQIPCPRCGVPILRLRPSEPEEWVTCPRCGHRFEPVEEFWVDAEDI